ncbi:Sua5/YciO/YrdC/YwlC family protein [Shewanella phaeophyticola]|uniref:Sua5/YciO/YrdC/YwlC family protein n=1 Tax=Shewanella phaeophyticola TaxID=2978345 RepID=UPI0028F6ED87|nr:Sua5/YciO/YrdC/YwlC family protein [Shewanella sp. KJ10-1]
MAKFDMCPECAASYTDPLNRRYHAQPVSCPQCGTQLQLSILSPAFNAFTEDDLLNQNNLLEQTAKLIKQGAIIAIKGLGGFHLVCDATNDDAISRLRQRKQRPAKPLAIMIKDLNQARLCVTANQTEWDYTKQC